MSRQSKDEYDTRYVNHIIRHMQKHLMTRRLSWDQFCKLLHRVKSEGYGQKGGKR